MPVITAWTSSSRFSQILQTPSRPCKKTKQKKKVFFPQKKGVICHFQQQRHKALTLFEHIGTLSRAHHTLVPFPQMKIMRPFDVRRPRAPNERSRLLRTHESPSVHLERERPLPAPGPRHRGGLAASWRGAGFNDEGNGRVCRPFQLQVEGRRVQRRRVRGGKMNWLEPANVRGCCTGRRRRSQTRRICYINPSP